MRFDRFHIIILAILIALMAFQPIGCGPSGSGTVSESPDDGDQDGDGDGDGTTVTATPRVLSLSVSKTTVTSNDVDSATITATVLDKNNAAIEGLDVSFSASGGRINASSVATDANGQAKISLYSGSVDPSNKTVTVTARVTGLSAVQIPVKIVGSTLTMSTDNTTITDSGSIVATLTVSAKNAAGSDLYNIPITLTSSGSGTVTISPSSGKTNYDGEFTATVTGSSSGSVTITADGLGTTAAQTLTIGTVGATFGITTPTTDPYSLKTNQDLTITVTAPIQNNVRFATTLGTLIGSVQTGKVVVEPVTGNTASVVLRSTIAGTANIQIFDADATAPDVADSLIVAISAPTSEASSVELQTSATAIAPSTGDVINTATLSVTVRNASGQPVGSAPVAFSIVNPVGNETIDPVIVYTNTQGKAFSTFSSGSLSTSASGVTVKASVVGFTPAIEDTISLIIGGTPGSVVIGRGTKVESINNDAAYKLPMSLVVADANGNPVSGAVVSLNAWPAGYARGYWIEVDDDKCEAVYTSTHTNEDLDRDLSLDANEDTNGDGELTPPNSAAGTLPDVVKTDSNGVAQFDLVYTKSSSVWIKDEITATVQVSGTETQSTYPFWLPVLKGEECNLADSPYNRVGQGVSVTAQPSEVVANGANTTTISSVVTDASGNAVPDGETVNFSTTAGTFANSQTIYSATTTGGIAQAVLTSPTTTGSSKITVSYGSTTEEVIVEFVPGPSATITVSASTSSLNADGSSYSTITALVTDAAGNIVADGESISFSITTGSGTLSSLSGITYDGRVTTIYTASTTTGTVTITARSSSAASGLVNITLVSPVVESVVTVASSDSIVANGTSRCQIVATVRDVNDNLVNTTVTFSTTAGTLSSTTATTTNGVATVQLTSSTRVGTATVRASVGGASSSDTVNFIAGPVSDIVLTATPSTLNADGISTSTLTATVTDVNGNVVANGETITFTIESGSGTLSSQTATTIGGLATVTYTASTTAETVTIQAQSTVTSVFASVDITLAIAASGSMSITRGTKISGTTSTTEYTLPISVLVTDINGNPVGGAIVNLDVWPTQYSTGVWYDSDAGADTTYLPYIAGNFNNEDADEDLVYDPGEDANRDGGLTPSSSAVAGTVPPTVTTNANGIANFDLTYLKSSAIWIIDRLSASTTVLGSSITASITFRLPAEVTDATGGDLDDSSYTSTFTIAAGTGPTQLYDFLTFQTDAADVFSTFDANSSIPAYNAGPPPTNGLYSYDASGDAAGDIINDYVTVTNTGISATVPVDVVVE